PYKKKDIQYLLSSRLKNPRKKNVIIAHDINIQNKCDDCKTFQPWILLKNSGEGIFLLKKFVEKCEPWITTTIQENLYDFNITQKENYDNIFSLITKINSSKDLYSLIEKYKDVIINSDIRLKNQCLRCKNITPWLLIKKEPKGVALAGKLQEKFAPYIHLKKQKIIYKHNIPKIINNMVTWSWNEEVKYGKMKIKL
ncbi:unnamed protein product, partial [marine sediment metagenome]